MFAGVVYLERTTLCSTPLWRTDCVCWWSWTTICWRRSATTAATGDRYDKPYDWFTVLTNTVKHLFSSVEHKKQTWLITSMKIFTVFYVSGFKRCFHWLQVTSGSLAVYLSMNQEVWLETKDYRGMRGNPSGYSIFSGFLLHSHWPTGENVFTSFILRLFIKSTCWLPFYFHVILLYVTR